MIILYAVIAFAITYFLLRKSGGVKRHLIAFLVAAIAAIVLTFLTFELVYPYEGYNTTPRFNAEMVWTMGGFAAAVVAPILGMLAAKFARGRTLR